MSKAVTRPGAWRLILAAIVLSVAASGCGPSLIKPKGHVVKNGTPLTFNKSEMLDIAFYPDDGSDEFYASVKPQDGNFIVLGRKGKGIPPGTYRVAVGLTKGSSQRDVWKGKFSKANSPFTFDLTSDKEEIVIDLGKE